MIGKFLEALFRHKLVILLPMFLTPLVVTPAGFYYVRPYFETSSTVWVGRLTYLKSADDTGSWWMSPAQVETGRISDLFRIRPFVLDVAKRTDLAPLVGSEQGEEIVLGYFARNVLVGPAGNNLITFTARADQAKLAFQVANAVVETYRERRADERTEQAGVAISFHEARLQQAQEELAKATADIRRYVAANPRLTTIDPNRGAASTAAARMGLPPIAIDPQLAELIRRVDAEQKDVDNIRAALDQARMETAAGMEGQDVNFRVVDAARVPSAPVSQRRRLLIFPVAGLVVGLGLGLGLLVALVVADRSIRTTLDLPAGVRVARVVPFLPLRKLARQTRPRTTRQAIGFVAGAALSSPRGVR
jgi:capsular polysaccharide biosynthesis protein